MKPCIKAYQRWFKQRPLKHQQWLWCIALWCAGLAAVSSIGMMIRLVIVTTP